MRGNRKQIAAGLNPHEIILRRRGKVIEASHVQRTPNGVNISTSRFVVLKPESAERVLHFPQPIRAV